MWNKKENRGSHHIPETGRLALGEILGLSARRIIPPAAGIKSVFFA
jgi:hypothetical protein